MNRFENIPQELRALEQWVVAVSDSKIPINANTGEAASSTNPYTWVSFEEATHRVECLDADNIGFVFNDNGIVGIDIDAGYDDEGFVSALAADIIDHCKSYTERSRSGRGFHILLKGELPFKGKNNLKGVEIYKAARYFIMTGDTLLYRDIVENQFAVDYVVETYFADELRDIRPGGNANRIYNPVWDLPVKEVKRSETEDEGINDSPSEPLAQAQRGARATWRIKLRPVYPRIPNGCRNICLTSLAGMMHNQGYNKQQIYDELTYANIAACDPSLDDYEVQNIVSSVTRYKR